MGISNVNAHMWRFVMTSHDEQGNWLVKKTTEFVSNLHFPREPLDKKRIGNHRYVQLMGSKAKGRGRSPVAYECRVTTTTSKEEPRQTTLDDSEDCTQGCPVAAAAKRGCVRSSTLLVCSLLTKHFITIPQEYNRQLNDVWNKHPARLKLESARNV